MFRHLSPKPNLKDKPTVTLKHHNNNNDHLPSQPSRGLSKHLGDKVSPISNQDIKNLNHFLTNNNTSPTQNKRANMPAPQVIVHKNNSSDSLKDSNKKTSGNTAFDDYYGKKPKIFLEVNKKKEDGSRSNDSCQSEKRFPIKKTNGSTRSMADKMSPRNKNFVNVPLAGNKNQNDRPKSPSFKLGNRSDSEDENPIKRVLSFGGKKSASTQCLQDHRYGKNNKEDATIGNRSPCTPQPQTTILKFPSPNMSDSKNRPPINKKQLASPKENKPKNLPNVLSSGYIKSPFHNKFALDSSNESLDDILKKKPQKQKIEPLLGQLKKEQKNVSKDQKDKKSLSFNKEEMFMNLKKRQEHHNLIAKQINTLNIKIYLKIVASNEPVEFILTTKLFESKNTGIYIAHHPKSSSVFCLKRVTLNSLNKQQKGWLASEHKIQQFCRHPHLVKGYATAYSSTHLFLIMEYMEEGSLGAQLRKEVFKDMTEESQNKDKQAKMSQTQKTNRIKKMLYEIGGAVRYLHERGIIHRDIKPQNIFISHDTFKLGDLGSASYNGSQQYVGTLDYASPQILSQTHYDSKIDMWSLGCVAYQLAVGRPPFFHKNQQQTKRLSIQAQYDKNLVADQELRSLIDSMLCRQPSRRLSSVQLMQSQFLRSLSQEHNYF